MSLFIRTATVADAALIADISRTTFFETFAAQNTKEDMDKFLAEQFTTSDLIAEVGVPGNIFLLAYLDEALAGYVYLQDNNNIPTHEANALEIKRIYVLKSNIGKGIGRALMQAGINTAKEKNKQIIWLGVWEQNRPAIDFYTAWGFEKFDTHNFVLGNDVQQDWLMKKWL